MTKLLLIALMLIFATGSAIAQQQGGPGSKGGGQGKSGAYNGSYGDPVARLTETLGLDETQAAAIALIFEDIQLQREEQREQARALAEEMRATTHAAILGLLTDEQAIIFEAQAKDREAFRRKLEDLRANGGFGGRRGSGTGDCMQ